jgi:hypothetical protein
MNDILKKAIQERDEFLEKHPHMKEFQAEIDGILEKCSSQEDRLATSQILLSVKLKEFSEQLDKIQYIADKISGGKKAKIIDKRSDSKHFPEGFAEDAMKEALKQKLWKKD